MAGAMLRRWLACGLNPAAVTVIRPSGSPVAEGIAVLTTVPADAPPPALLLLGMKPHQLAAAAPDYAGAVHPDTILLSILAGTDHAMLRRHFPMLRSICRSMPNLPVAIGKGITATFEPDNDPALRSMIDRLLTPLGLVEWLADEAQLDAVTALAGCGPAFVFRLIAALAKAGSAHGLDTARALRLALAMTEGSAILAASSNADPDTLADRVASKGGVTAAGLAVLDQDDALDRLIAATIAASIARNREMEQHSRMDNPA